MTPLIDAGKIILGIEILRCPQCNIQTHVEIHSDMPAHDWLACRGCGYRAILDYAPFLVKYGLPGGMSRPERRSFGRHLKRDIAKI